MDGPARARAAAAGGRVAPISEYGEGEEGEEEGEEEAPRRPVARSTRPATADERPIGSRPASRPAQAEERPLTAEAPGEEAGVVARPSKPRMSMMPSAAARMKREAEEAALKAAADDAEAARLERARRLIEKERPPKGRPQVVQPLEEEEEEEYEVPVRAAPVRARVAAPTSPVRAVPAKAAAPARRPLTREGENEEEDDGSRPIVALRRPAAPSTAASAAAIPRELGATFGMGSGIFDEGGPRIKVVVRKRPMSRKEAAAAEMDTVRCTTRRTLQVHEIKRKVDLTRFTEVHEFSIDDAFDETVSTEYIYQKTAAPLIGGLLRGANATCFAYGQTGSGKTFTMMGDVKEGRMVYDPSQRQNLGLYVLAARDLFRMLQGWEQRQAPSVPMVGGHPKKGIRRLAVVISFFEIYGGKLFDLLNAREALKALVDAQGDVIVMGVAERRVEGVEGLLKLIDQGLAARSTGTTGANSDSSRSHAVLQIVLAEAVADGKGGVVVLTDNRTKKVKALGKFSVIDLAGSERGADTMHNDKKTRLEGAEINKSLLALKECIRSLYQESDYNPFRGSKLTQVLKDSFVGDSRTVMIANISPNMSNTEHTLNTLRYAYRVKEIRRDDADVDAREPPHGVRGGEGYEDETDGYLNSGGGAVGGLSPYLAAQAAAMGNRGAGVGGGVNSAFAAAAAAADASAASNVRVSPLVMNEGEEDADDSLLGRELRPRKARESLAPSAMRRAAPASAQSVAAIRPSVGGAGSAPLPRAVEAKPAVRTKAAAPVRSALPPVPRAQISSRAAPAALPKGRLPALEAGEEEEEEEEEERRPVAPKPRVARPAWVSPARSHEGKEETEEEGEEEEEGSVEEGDGSFDRRAPAPAPIQAMSPAGDRRTRRGAGTPDIPPSRSSPARPTARATPASSSRSADTGASYEGHSDFRGAAPPVLSVDLSSPLRAAAARRAALELEAAGGEEEEDEGDFRSAAPGSASSHAASRLTSYSARHPRHAALDSDLYEGEEGEGEEEGELYGGEGDVSARMEETEEDDSPPPPPPAGAPQDGSAAATQAARERMRAAAAAVTGAALTDAERALVSAHSETLDEMTALEAQERRLLAGSGLGGPESPAGRGGRSSSGGNAGLTRGEMARYVSLLQDVLNRKFVLVQDLIRSCEEYEALHGGEVGLRDPGAGRGVEEEEEGGRQRLGQSPGLVFGKVRR
jgi:hypothetical protein